MDGLRELIDEQKKRAPLMFDGETEDDDPFENPALDGPVINEGSSPSLNTCRASICRFVG